MDVYNNKKSAFGRGGVGSWGKGGLGGGGSAQRLKALIVCVNVYFGRCRALLFSSAFVVFPEKCIKTEYLLFL